MGDMHELEELYKQLYRAMIEKDRAAIEAVCEEDFVLIHMTGMRQDREAFAAAVVNGTLNYYSEETAGTEIKINDSGDRAAIDGRSEVSAAVFGGGRHTWKLRLNIDAVKTEAGWRFVKAEASVW